MLSVSNKTRQSIPGLPFLAITDKVLGKNYDLSLVFIGSNLSRSLNKTYRKKDKSANVLSFPYDKNQGEIFIDLGLTKKECEKFDHSFEKHLGFLFIHGALHLKGLDHGSRMEGEEAKLIKTFLDVTNNRHRAGYRHFGHSRRSLRIQKRK